MNQTPIAVISFNRPRYLREVLDSLLAQTELDNRSVYLFQDNAVSPHTGARFAEDKDVAACVALFREKFPTGTVVLAEHNLGIARNFLRAEELLFQTLGNDGCYFFEDDMVLSPHYLTMMDRLHAFAQTTDRIGYFAAFGALMAPLQKQRERAKTVTRLSYHWAFGLTRRHWTDLRAWLDAYYKFGEGRDYKHRNRREIVEHYRALGAPLMGANQDVMKQIGTCMLGRVSINTVACFGKYIGAEGLHFTQETYDRHGFERTELYPEPVELDFPTAETLEQMHAKETKIRWDRFSTVRARDARRALRTN